MELKNPTRTEALLANIAGYTDVPVPDMKNATRSERLLKEILDNGGGGGGEGVTKEYVDNAIADAVTAIDEDISDITGAVENKVDKVNGKGLSTNDYTDADKALVQDSPITVVATASPISTANGKPRAITIYGKSEVVDGAIKSAGDSGSIEIETCEKNLFDPTKLVTENITYTDGTLSGTAGNFHTAYNNGIPVLFDKTRQITFSAKIYTSSEYLIGRGLLVEFVYTDNTSDVLEILNATTEPRVFTITSNSTKQVQYIGITYGVAATNMWHLSEIQLEYGSSATAYEPYNGTMATFSTGTPLYGVSADIRDVMEWDGSSGEVTKKCADVNLGTQTWQRASEADHSFYIVLSDIDLQSDDVITNLTDYTQVYSVNDLATTDKSFLRRIGSTAMIFRNTAYTEPTDIKTSMNGKTLIYKLATPVVEPLTTAENESIAGLKTYSPQTVISINDSPEFEVEAYANTANGQAISDMQPTRSPLLTLSASGWTNNAQTVTFAHDTGKRNTIDVEPANIKAWTAAGILATAETASTITFECDTVPTSDLSFRVTSMEVR